MKDKVKKKEREIKLYIELVICFESRMKVI